MRRSPIVICRLQQSLELLASAAQSLRRGSCALLNYLGETFRPSPIVCSSFVSPGIFVPKLSLPVRLALLVAGTTLPLILFAAGIVFYNYEQDRKDATQRVLETVRAIRLVLDAEVQRMTGGLQVLSLTNSLRNGDFDSFRRIALGFLDQYGKDGVVLVADREGRQLFSSVTTDTASLPPRNNRDIVEKVFATKQPTLLEPVRRRREEAADRHRRGAGHAQRRGASTTSRSARRSISSRPSSKSSGRTRTGPFRSSTAKAPTSPAYRTRRTPSASAHRRRCMPRCSANPRRRSPRCRSKACR